MRPLLAVLLLAAAPAFAQHAGHSGHGGHGGHGASAPGPMATEAGQGGFAALAEVVEILRADPDTDWSRVDIPALIAHLRDMEALVTRLEVTTEDVPGGARFTIELPAAASNQGIPR